MVIIILWHGYDTVPKKIHSHKWPKCIALFKITRTTVISHLHCKYKSIYKKLKQTMAAINEQNTLLSFAQCRRGCKSETKENEGVVEW